MRIYLLYMARVLILGISSAIMLSILFFGCKKDKIENDEAENELDHYIYTVPELLNDGWEVASLDTSKAEIVRMFTVVDGILAGEYTEIHSFLNTEKIGCKRSRRQKFS